jgi:anaerobic selenocysteine-containing dehydrogenase
MLRAKVEGGRLVGIEPAPENRATEQGPCLKGLAYVERANSRQRVLHPLRRQSNGGFAEIGWDEAIGAIADMLERVRAESGAQSVLYYSASGTKGLLNACGLSFWRTFGGCTTTYGDLCWPAGLEATRLTLGANSHNAPWDLENARLIVMWGKNPAETNIHQMPHIDSALERGGTLVVVDPRRTETAERATLFLPLRPGTDGALALAVGHILVRDDHIDHAFVADHVLGFEEWAAAVRPWTPARAADVCGVPESSIERLAALIGTMHPATIVAGYGMQRYTNSGQTMRAMIALLAVTGQIGRPGAGWMFANLQTHVFDTVKSPLSLYPPDRPEGGVRVSISTARLGRDMKATTDPALRFAWVERGNPIPQNPETNVVIEAFRALDFRVVVEEFMTDTAREADIVLPAKNFFEQTDVIGAYWHPYLQLRRKAVEPPAGVKPETEIYRALGRRLGIDEARLDAILPGPSDEAIDAWLEGRLAPLGLTLHDFRDGPVLSPDFEEVAFRDRSFPTPSGRIELVSEEASRRWGVGAVPDFSEAEERPQPDGPYPLHLLTPNTKNRIHSQFGNLDTIRRMAPEPFMTMHPRDAGGRGIANGDRARVFNERGELTLPVRFDLGLRTGCVCVTNGFWISEGGAVNVLTRGRETDMGHGAAFHDNAVQVERA